MSNQEVPFSNLWSLPQRILLRELDERLTTTTIFTWHAIAIVNFRRTRTIQDQGVLAGLGDYPALLSGDLHRTPDTLDGPNLQRLCGRK